MTNTGIGEILHDDADGVIVIHQNNKAGDSVFSAGLADFCDVTIVIPRSNSGDNRDEFAVYISTENGQEMIGSESETTEVMFSIVGPIEFGEFILQMGALANLYKEGKLAWHTK